MHALAPPQLTMHFRQIRPISTASPLETRLSSRQTRSVRGRILKLGLRAYGGNLEVTENASMPAIRIGGGCGALGRACVSRTGRTRRVAAQFPI